MNIARWFSYTRAVEFDRDYWRAKAETWQNYALTRSQLPPLSIVATSPVPHPAPPPRPSLASIRRRFVSRGAVEAVVSNGRDGNGDTNGHAPHDDMVAAADDYARRVKNGGT